MSDRSPTRVLAVTHNVTAQHKIQQSLVLDSNDQFLLVNSAAKALEILREQSFAVILVDVDTLDLDGWRLTRLIRAGILACNAQVPILMFANTWCERIAEVTAREYGINVFLPLDQLDQVNTHIQTLLNEPNSISQLPSLLVIEDQQDTSELVKRVLSTQFNIEIASAGLQGLEKWKHGRHKLVLLDVMLPELSGHQVLAEIMKHDEDQAVVIMTAHADIDQAELLMRNGAVDFLAKPFRPDQLRRVCSTALMREDYLVSNTQFAERVKEVHESKEAHQKLNLKHQRLLNDLQSIVMELDEKLTITFLNEAWEHITGIPVSECINKPLREFIPEDRFNAYYHFEYKLLNALNHEHVNVHTELCINDAVGRILWLTTKFSSPDESIDQSKITVCLENITDQKIAHARLEHLTMHDSLTGLYNRHYFEAALEQFSSNSIKTNSIHGLIYLDLDHFKVINDSFGHQRGDDVLREIAGLLRKHAKSEDVLCHIGSDEFTLLVRNTTKKALHDLASKIQAEISDNSFKIKGQRIHLGCSVGVALIDGSVSMGEDYLVKADIALYIAKDRGRNLIHHYNPNDAENEEIKHSANWSQKIRDGIREDRVVLYFQPILDVNENKVSYYEALVRLKDSSGIIIGPDSFIPSLEKKGEMPILDRHVVSLAIKALAEHKKLQHISINLSSQAFKDGALLSLIKERLDEHKVSPTRVTFELTESASLFNLAETQRVIRELHSLGCRFAVDDFGSGFSSFSYLKQLPADIIKIDGSFIQNLHNDAVDQALVKSIVQVIKALGKKAVAEYVENKEIHQLLTEMHIDYVQGHYVGLPLPIDLINQSKSYDTK